MDDAALAKWLREKLPRARVDSRGPGMTYKTGCNLLEALASLLALLGKAEMSLDLLMEKAVQAGLSHQDMLDEEQTWLRLRAVLGEGR